MQPPALPTAQHVADRIAALTGRDRHDALVVLGSGWGPAADALGEPVVEAAMADIGLLPPVAQGHRGLLRSCTVAGRPVLVLLGRTHLYEGHGRDAVTLPARATAACGVRVAVLTNANGSLRPDWPVGQPVVVADHLDLTATGGLPVGPLTGPPGAPGTRPPVWSPRLRALLHDVDPTLPHGVYAMAPGPHYETRAEALAMRAVGADLVGMSAVPEAVALAGRGVEVAGLSVVTALELDASPIDPADVVAVAEAGATRTGPVIREVLARALA